MNRILLFLLTFPLLAVAQEDSAALRADFLRLARPSVSNILTDTEQKIGTPVVFVKLPDNDAVSARFIYDTATFEPRILLRKGWDDAEVAHELQHARMDLVDRLPMLAWRRGVARTPEIEAAFGRLQTYVKDEIVHARLAETELAFDGEVIRANLFDNVYEKVTRHLEAGRDHANDGMAHLDKSGHGTLVRVCFLLQAELLLKNHRARLPARRIEQTEKFIRAFRAHRKPEAAVADAVLELFRTHDVNTPEGHREILVRWTKLATLEKFVGPSSYARRPDGRYTLPFPD